MTVVTDTNTANEVRDVRLPSRTVHDGAQLIFAPRRASSCSIPRKDIWSRIHSWCKQSRRPYLCTTLPLCILILNSLLILLVSLFLLFIRDILNPALRTCATFDSPSSRDLCSLFDHGFASLFPCTASTCPVTIIRMRCLGVSLGLCSAVTTSG